MRGVNRQIWDSTMRAFRPGPGRIETRINRAHGLVHGISPGSRNGLTSECWVTSLIDALPSVRWTMKNCHLTMQIADQQRTIWVFDHVRVKFMRVSNSCIARDPIVTG